MTNESDGVDMSTNLFDENNVENDGIYEEDDNQKKSYLALNVFVETIFIVGESISGQNWSLLYFIRPWKNVLTWYQYQIIKI